MIFKYSRAWRRPCNCPNPPQSGLVPARPFFAPAPPVSPNQAPPRTCWQNPSFCALAPFLPAPHPANYDFAVVRFFIRPVFPNHMDATVSVPECSNIEALFRSPPADRFRADCIPSPNGLSNRLQYSESLFSKIFALFFPPPRFSQKRPACCPFAREAATPPLCPALSPQFSQHALVFEIDRHLKSSSAVIPLQISCFISEGTIPCDRTPPARCFPEKFPPPGPPPVPRRR